MSAPLPYIRYSADQRYLIVEPGVESDFFKLDNPVSGQSSTTALVLDVTNRFVIKTIPVTVGDVVGPAGATDNAVARFDGTTGKIIQNSVVIIDDAGNITGVGTINGKSLPASGNFGNVTGPGVSTDNALARWDGTSGQFIQNSVAVLDDAGNLSGITTINGGTISGNNSGDVTLTAFGSSPNANGASLTGQALTLQPASGAFPGGVTTVAQTFAGAKTFSSPASFSNGTAVLGGMNFSAHNGDGVYYDTGAGALALASGSVPRYIAFRQNAAVVNGGTTPLFNLTGLSIFPWAHAMVVFGIEVSDGAGNRQVATGTAWACAYNDAGVVDGAAADTAAVKTVAGTLTFSFDVNPVSADVAQVILQANSSFTTTTFIINYSVLLPNDPDIGIVFL
jgi:hypothetical protein